LGAVVGRGVVICGPIRRSGASGTVRRCGLPPDPAGGCATVAIIRK